MNQILVYTDFSKRKEKLFYKFLLLFCFIILLFLFLYLYIDIYVIEENPHSSANTSSAFYVQNLFTSTRLSANVEYTEPEDEENSGFSVIGMLSIEKIDLVNPILSDTNDELLKIALCKYCGPDIHEIGNFCIVGHNLNNSKFFGRLNEVKIGDVIDLYNQKRENA